MTNEEAIKIIREEHCTRCPMCNPNCCYAIAINAIEKQIPKEKHKYNGIRCVCGEHVAEKQDYCEYCGQRLLEWKEVRK